MPNISSSRRGFTLVELIIVVSIIAVLASLAFMALSGETAQARDSKRVSDLKTFEDAIATSNGKNKKINTAISAAVPDSATTATVYSLSTSAGTVFPLRGAKLMPVSDGIFDSDVVPSIARDPKGSPYYVAFLSNTDYQFFATAENPDTKKPTAIVRGTFKSGAILDILTSDINPGVTAIPVSTPNRFVKGDVITLDGETLTVASFNTTTGTVTTGATTKAHNKGAAIKLTTPVTNSNSLFCLGEVDTAATGNAIVDTANKWNTAMAGAAATGVVCAASDEATNTPATKGVITDQGNVLPYIVTAN